MNEAPSQALRVFGLSRCKSKSLFHASERCFARMHEHSTGCRARDVDEFEDFLR